MKQILSLAIMALLMASCGPRERGWERFVCKDLETITLEDPWGLHLAYPGQHLHEDGVDWLICVNAEHTEIHALNLSDHGRDSMLFRAPQGEIFTSYACSLDSIWYLSQDIELANTRHPERIFHYADTTLGRMRKRFSWHATQTRFDIVDSFLYLGVTYAKPGRNYDYARHAHQPPLSRWKLQGGEVRPDCLFGRWPSTKPFDNYFDQQLMYLYNPDDSLLVASSCLSTSVVLFDRECRFIEEKMLSDKCFHVLPFTYEQFQDVGEFIRYGETAPQFGPLLYDPYRQVYLRPLYLEPQRDTLSMTRRDIRPWRLIVADRRFRVKYTVDFLDSPYTGALYVTPQAVYITTHEKQLVPFRFR